MTFRRGRVARASLAACLAAIAAACSGGATESTGGGPGEPGPPATPWTLDGPAEFQGGGFAGSIVDFAPQAFSLSNSSSSSQTWSVLTTANWLEIDGPSSGDLAPGAEVEIVIRVDALEFTNLAPGVYEADVVFHTGAGAGSVEFHRSTATLWVREPQGWTLLTPSFDTQSVYVSSSTGDDNNDGSSALTPKRTIAAALALMTDGYPDWVLLKKGDEWSESPPGGIIWNTGGRSNSEPTVLTSYGDPLAPRPVIRSGNENGLTIKGQAGSTISHIAVVGIAIEATGRDVLTQNPVGINVVQSIVNDLLIEDCYVRGYKNGISLSTYPDTLRHSDHAVRRCVIVENYTASGQGHAQGMFASRVDGLLVEECVFNNNGWSPTDPNAGPKNIYKHNLYVQRDNTGVVLRANLIANASSHGLQLRCGGSANDNLLIANPIGLQLGGGDDPVPGGVDSEALRNVIIAGNDIGPSAPRRSGIYLSNLSSGEVRENLVCHVGAGTGLPAAFSIYQSVTTAGPGPFTNVLVENNVVFDWGGMAINFGQFPGATFGNLRIANNNFADPLTTSRLIDHRDSTSTSGIILDSNTFWTGALADRWFEIDSVRHTLQDYESAIGGAGNTAGLVSYTDSARNIESYMTTLGETPTIDAFLAAAMAQSRDDWREEYTALAVNAYLRAGFDF